MNVQIGQFGAMKKVRSSLTGFASIISSEAWRETGNFFAPNAVKYGDVVFRTEQRED